MMKIARTTVALTLLTISCSATAADSARNLIHNGNFAEHERGWTLQLSNGAQGALDFNEDEQGTFATVAVPVATDIPYDIQLLQQRIHLRAGGGYRLEFTARCENEASIVTLFLQRDGKPWTALFKQEITLSPSWKEYSFDFVADTTANARLVFSNLGRASGVYDFTGVSLVCTAMPAEGDSAQSGWMPSEGWVPDDPTLNIKPGSVFDFSGWTDAPAGKYGYIQVDADGRFSFPGNPDAPVSFYGVNLCFGAIFPSREEADALADTLLRSGYNSVRIHHYDREIVVPGRKSWELDPEKLDRMDYLFYALKRRGLYINIDLYSSRPFSKDEIPDVSYELTGRAKFDFKFILPLSTDAFNSWKKFASNLLTHTNPYTGMTWAEDPALIGICPVNEDAFFYKPLASKSEEVVELWETAFDKWAQDKDLSSSGEDTDAQFNRFVAETYAHNDERMRDYLRSLGVKAPISGSNFMVTMAQAFLRDRYDYVDTHQYWNHPSFRESAIGYNMTTVLKDMWLPRTIMPTRIFGKPFVVTEYNFCWPNASRGEGAMVLASYARLQDWDGLYLFDYAASEAAIKDMIPLSRDSAFSISSDPISLLASRAGAFLYRKGGIQTAKSAICYVVNSDTAYAGARGIPRDFPETFSWLGMITRIGSLTSDNQEMEYIAADTDIRAFVTDDVRLPALSDVSEPVILYSNDLVQQCVEAQAIPPVMASSLDDSIESETGQIRLSRQEQSFVLTTDLSECFTLPPHQTLSGDIVTVSNEEGLAAVYILSVDGVPLTEARRLLVLHLTDSLYTGTTFEDESRSKLTDFGFAPVLLREGRVRIALQGLSEDAPWKCWAVNFSGERLWPVDLVQQDGAWVLEASVKHPQGVAVAYELIQSSRE